MTRANDAGAAGVISTPAPANTPGIKAKLAAPETAPAPIFQAGTVTVVSYAAAKNWAVTRELCARLAPLDLHAVNAFRRRRGEPPFALLGGE